MKKRYHTMPNVVFDHYLLRTIHKKDYRDMYDYGKDNEVTKYLTWGPMTTPKEAKRSIKGIFYPRVKQGLPRGYAIVDLHNDKMIGTIDFHSKPANINGAEVGFCLHKDYWNQGIMTKALKELITIGFEYLEYDVILIKHLKSNIASQKVILKANFQYVSQEPFKLEKSTQVIDETVVIYQLTKERYYASK